MANVFDVNIKFKRDFSDSYIIDSNTTVLGRQFSNKATRINVTIPIEEKGNICFMYVYSRFKDELLDLHIVNENEPIYITRNISKENVVRIIFKFFNDVTGYTKWSNLLNFTFSQGMNACSNDFVPPEERPNFFRLWLSAFASCSFDSETNELVFRNMQTNEVQRVPIPTSIGGSNHAELDNLEYSVSGHTGFASGDDLQKISDDFEELKDEVSGMTITFETI